MRSRDGNQARLFTVCSIILFYSLPLLAGEYLVSYRYVVKNMILYNESFHISPAMKKCSGTPQESIELALNKVNDFNSLVDKSALEFREYIETLGLEVEHQENTRDFQNTATTVLTFKTACFKVDFNDNFARISHLK